MVNTGGLPDKARDTRRKTGWRRLYAACISLLIVILCLTAGLPPAGARRTEAAGEQRQDVRDARDEDPALEVDFPFETGKQPAYFSWADEGRKPKVRSQEGLYTCWALCAVSAVEAQLLPERTAFFSADHMTRKNGYAISQSDGGDYYMIMSYLADWKGPVPEEEDPYGDGESPDGLSAAVHVQQMQLLGGMDRSQIKQMILDNGPLQSSLCMDTARVQSEDYHYYNADTCSYHNPMAETVNHDILVLGWDDGFSREQFRIKPRNDGAWICQNTWGEEFGLNGLFYVSYEDANLFRKGGIAYSKVEDSTNYDFVRENDSLGWLGRQGYGESRCLYAGVFRTEGAESLAAAGLYVTGADSSYRISLVPEFTGSGSLSGPSELLAFGKIATAGYYTVEFPRPYRLAAGQEYAIIVEMDTPGASKPAVVEMEKDAYTTTVTLEGRETYISKNGSVWENTQKTYGTNVCLKAYTRSAEE
jgi:C1A family cysteine protease